MSILEGIFSLIKSKLQEIQFLKDSINGYYFECAPYDAAHPLIIISLGEPQISANIRANDYRTELQIGVLGANCQVRNFLEPISLALDRKIFETQFGKIIIQLKELVKSNKTIDEVEEACVELNTLVFDLTMFSS